MLKTIEDCQSIVINGKDVGQIRIFKIRSKIDIYELEYALDDEYQNKGIMSKELPKFMKKHKDKFMQAQILRDNIASQKVIKKAGFYFFETIENKKNQIIDIYMYGGARNKYFESVLQAFKGRLK